MAKKISFGGICTALSVVCLLLVNIFVTNRIFFTCLATIFIPICVIKCGLPFGIGMWAASSGVAFLIVPDKMVWAAFLVLGGYTLLKGFIEKIPVFAAQWILKLAFYAVSFTAAMFIFPLSDNKLIWIIFGAGAVVFVIYDIVLSMGITYITKKFKLF